MPDTKLNGTRTRTRKTQSGAVNDDHLDEQLTDPTEGDELEVESGEGLGEDQQQPGDDLIALREAKEAAEARAAEAERRTAKAEAKVTDQNKDIIDSRTQVVNSMITTEEGRKNEVKTKIRAAKDAGDFDAETDALDELQQVNLKLAQLNNSKLDLERVAEREKDRPADPIEAYSANMNDRAKAWMRAHPERVTNPTKNAELVTAHWHAMDRGLEEGTDAYYDSVERELGYKEKARTRAAEVEVDDVDDEPKPRPRREALPPAARPSREAVEVDLPRGMSRTSDGKYRLDARHREAAEMAGVSYSKYAEQMLTMKRNGEIQ